MTTTTTERSRFHAAMLPHWPYDSCNRPYYNHVAFHVGIVLAGVVFAIFVVVLPTTLTVCKWE